MNDIAPYLDDLINWRRHLHRHPEISFQEHQTVAWIRSTLEERLTDVSFEHPTPTSLLVKLDTRRPGPKLAVRADIDALAVQEDRADLDFASQEPGRMHACGHDGHTAIVMAAAAWAADHRDELNGEVWFIFQHAEETPPGGAKEMVAAVDFSDLDHIFGFHLWSTLPTGTIDVKDGAASANSDLFEVIFRGNGVHASTPQDGVDPVIAATQFVAQAQTLISRRVPPLHPAVLSTTWLDAGNHDALNVIPMEARIGGSIRSQSDEAREIIRTGLHQLAAGLEAAHPGLSIEVDHLQGYDMVWNHPEPSAVVRELAERIAPGKVLAEPPMLGGEDFAAFAQVAPATYVFVGAGNAEKGFDSSHHSPTFGLDEDSFPIALQLVVDVLCSGERLRTSMPEGSPGPSQSRCG
ncbi:amidohydrolase [Luteococcus sp. Sow4_B9]|uniref:amidohydrolase n=1 Tax=Luteococcus sp. Sow4_B9 TaxID=3438792 RepID=UPI003F97D45C